MEYVQAVLFQLPANRVGEASRPGGLLAELDQHRNYLEQQSGFQDMRVVRSINTEGEVQLVVQTRWLDDETLVAYETREPTVMSIVSKHQELLVPGSLQVMDMEAMRAEPWGESAVAARELRERVAYPLLVPAAAFLFGVLVVYFLSRIYLEIRAEDVEIADLSLATPLATAVAAGILGIAWYLAARPRIPMWQLGGIAFALIGAIVGGGIFALVHETESEAAEPAAATEPAQTPAAEAGGPLSIAMVPSVRFDKSELTIAASQDVAVAVDNQDPGQFHNFAVYTDDSANDLLFATEICRAPCTESLTLNLPAGDYFFRCDVHPTEMTGTLTAR